MEKDFDFMNDEKSLKVIEILTPKHLDHAISLKKVSRKKHGFSIFVQISAIAAMVLVVLVIGLKLFQPHSIYAMPSTSREVLTNAINAIKELKSISLEFDARIQSVTPDYAECSNTGTPAKCRYRCLQEEGIVLQRVDFDFDSIKICNIYVNDTVYMYKDNELLYKGIKEMPTGLKSLVKIQNVLEKFSDYEDIRMDTEKDVTTLRSETKVEGGILVTEGSFDNRTGLLNSCRNFYVYEGVSFPIAESTKAEYNIPIVKEDILHIP